MYRTQKRRFWPKIKSTIIGAVILSIIVLLLYIFSHVVLVAAKQGLTPSNLLQIVFSDGILLPSKDNHVNVLLMGVGGAGHEGGDLTDSMIIISFNQKDHSTALISIPRDIWSDTLKDKVNSAYHYGELKQKNGGLALAKIIVEDVVGIPIHFSVLFDFSVFESAVNFVGGVDITVPTSFIDTLYPVAGRENDTCNGDPTFACRYVTVSFQQGLQHMDGTRALEYVRSRHSESTEGSDFARTRRQQDVIIAIKQKIVDVREWPGMAFRLSLANSIRQKIVSDMNVAEGLTFGKAISKISLSNIKKIEIDQLYVNPSPRDYNGLYVLIPKDTIDSVHTFIATNLDISTSQ